jgi:uncharacterized protein (TIGR02246 family)
LPIDVRKETMPEDERVRSLYGRLIDAWNDRDAEEFASCFHDSGLSIGFDGSVMENRESIASELGRIFADHETAPYVSKVRTVRLLSDDVVLLRAVSGMVPPGQTDINPDVNSHHTLIAEKRAGEWLITLFQNTPAQFHGRPELREALTQELRELL